MGRFGLFSPSEIAKASHPERFRYPGEMNQICFTLYTTSQGKWGRQGRPRTLRYEAGGINPGEIKNPKASHPERVRYPGEMNQIRFTGQAGQLCWVDWVEKRPNLWYDFVIQARR